MTPCGWWTGAQRATSWYGTCFAGYRGSSAGVTVLDRHHEWKDRSCEEIQRSGMEAIKKCTGNEQGIRN